MHHFILLRDGGDEEPIDSNFYLYRVIFTNIFVCILYKKMKDRLRLIINWWLAPVDMENVQG